MEKGWLRNASGVDKLKWSSTCGRGKDLGRDGGVPVDDSRRRCRSRGRAIPPPFLSTGTAARTTSRRPGWGWRRSSTTAQAPGQRPGWGWLIDASAVFMTSVSVSGIVLLLFLQKRRYSGLLAGVVGAALCLAVYLVWAP